MATLCILNLDLSLAAWPVGPGIIVGHLREQHQQWPGRRLCTRCPPRLRAREHNCNQQVGCRDPEQQKHCNQIKALRENAAPPALLSTDRQKTKNLK